MRSEGLCGTISPDGKRTLNVKSRQGDSIYTKKEKGKTMADEEIVVEENDEETETELEVLQSIRDDIRYFIKCTVPNSVYVDFEFPSDDS